MPGESIYEPFLIHQGFALFESLGGGEFEPIGDPPAWATALWQVAGGAHVRLGEKSFFLENFLIQAEIFWNSPAGDSVESGAWTEQDPEGKDVQLEASALSIAGRNVLLVHNLGAGYSVRQQVYQTARDSLLEHERLIREIQKKEILLHCIVHDLSQPLTAMRGCFDLLLVETLPPNIAKFVNIGHRESLRQEQMIRGILEAFSSDLSSQQSPGKDSAGPPDLAASVKDSVEQFSPAYAERGIHIVVDPRLDTALDWHAIGDSPRLERIFGNLLENALRYSPKGSTVTVGLEDRGSSILAFVDDEGPGLPRDASHDRIFALFSKGKDKPGKAGLGLYFCKMTVERWGGTIGADNRLGGGTRFWFRLLRAPKAAAAPASSATENAPPAPVAAASPRILAAPSKTLRVLVADDNETILELAVELLRARGHAVTPVTDGRAALAAFDKQKFDVLLLDQEMPHLNGQEVAQAIREREKKSGAHHILINLTGNASAADTQRSLEAGFDALLPKPFDRNILFELVESGTLPSTSVAAPATAGPSSDTQGKSAERASSGGPEAIPLPAAHAAPDLAEHLHHITNGSPTLLRSVVASFLSDAPKKVAAIRRALSRKNPEALASAAHSLKGAISIFNAQKSVSAARALEAMGRVRNLQAAADEFRALTDDMARLERDLRALVPPLPRRSKPRKPKRASKRRKL